MSHSNLFDFIASECEFSSCFHFSSSCSTSQKFRHLKKRLSTIIMHWNNNWMFLQFWVRQKKIATQPLPLRWLSDLDFFFSLDIQKREIDRNFLFGVFFSQKFSVQIIYNLFFLTLPSMLITKKKLCIFSDTNSF